MFPGDYTQEISLAGWVNDANCAKPENAKNRNCIEYIKAQAAKAKTLTVIAPENIAANDKATNKKIMIIVGGAVLAAVALVIIARRR